MNHLSDQTLAERFKVHCFQTMQQYGSIVKGDSLLVGLSGGADSVALLHFLWELAAAYDLKLTAGHLNHCLRGEESERDERFVRAVCEKLGIPLQVERRDIAAIARQKKMSVETCAREERYHFFAQHMQRGKIATAHNLDDHAETILLNLSRGTGLRGLCGIPPVRGQIVRPLIACSRKEVEGYCRTNHLSYVTDSTNLSEAYTRNRIRHRVIPVLEETNPAFLSTIWGMTETLRADANYLDTLAKEVYLTATRQPHEWDAALLKKQPQPVLRRVLLQMLAAHGIPQERRHVVQLESMLLNGGKAQVSAEWGCVCKRERFSFFPILPQQEQLQEPVYLHFPLEESEIPVFSDKKVRMTHWNYDQFINNANSSPNQFKNTLDYDKIERIVKLRCRLSGDRIRLAGRGCTKELRKLYNEAGLSAQQRARTLVLADENGPLWVEGFGVAQSVCIDQNTRQVLFIEIL